MTRPVLPRREVYDRKNRHLMKGDDMDLLQMGAQILTQQMGGSRGGNLLDSLGGLDGVADLAKGFFR